MSLAIHLYLDSRSPAGEQLADILFSGATEGQFCPKLAWLRAWQPGSPRAPEHAYFGIQPPADPDRPWDDTNRELVYPGESRLSCISFSDCCLDDCTVRVVEWMRQHRHSEWCVELRGTVPILVNVQESPKAVRVFRELPETRVRLAWPVLQVDLAKTTSAGGISYEITMLSFSSVWYHPFLESPCGRTINEAAADHNLQWWADWVAHIARLAQELLTGGEVTLGLRGPLREQEARILSFFCSRVPKMSHAWV